MTNQEVIKSISGNHLDGFGDENVVHVFTAKNSVIPIIPRFVCQKFTNLEVFHVINSKLDTITEVSFNGCTKLKDVDVRSNNLLGIPAYAFADCNQIKTVKLADNKITNVNVNAFFKCASLKELSLNQNKLSTLDQRTFNPLKELQFLSLSDNMFETLPGDNMASLFDSLSNLISLHLNYNRIKEVNENHFKSLSKLESLLLQGNKLLEIPFRTFRGLINLNYFDISENQLEHLHSRSFQPMNNLKDFIFSMNKIDAIDRRLFANATSMRQIQAKNNNCINENFLSIKNLQTNVLPDFESCFDNFSILFPTPVEICNYFDNDTLGYTCELTDVAFLEESENPLILGEHLDGRNNNDVSNVVFNSSRLVRVPPAIFTSFPNIKSLSIREVSLETLDEMTFEKCGTLQHLDISGNLIKTISSQSFENCEFLETIHLNNNSLSRVEPCGNFISKLEHLRYVSMRRNMCVDEELNKDELDNLRTDTRTSKLHQCFSNWFVS